MKSLNKDRQQNLIYRIKKMKNLKTDKLIANAE